MSSVFAYQERPRIWAQMRGEGEVWGVSANEYSCAHGAQINFGDLTTYLTNDWWQHAHGVSTPSVWITAISSTGIQVAPAVRTIQLFLYPGPRPDPTSLHKVKTAKLYISKLHQLFNLFSFFGRMTNTVRCVCSCRQTNGLFREDIESDTSKRRQARMEGTSWSTYHNTVYTWILEVIYNV